ncbi:VOC family protein [Nocardioides litoris]|uniref:VOC family protein n=1 Tax=Nocardioides litoris TaxID=1926648 RepID=UPI0011235092|nr:VOC family protein [Nocardioides litoris]
MNDDRKTIGPAEVAGELLEDWRYMLGALHARFATGDFATGLRLVQSIAAAAEEADHHPDVDLRYPYVGVRLSSHDVGGVTMRDVRLAREISRLADGVAEARPGALRPVELALDTPDHTEVAPFWAAVLGREVRDDDLSPGDDGLGVWFQQAPEARGEVQQRWHLDVYAAPEVAEQRVQEALAAGGTLVSDDRAPSFWVLADAHGNQACVCTVIGTTEQVPVGDDA